MSEKRWTSMGMAALVVSGLQGCCPTSCPSSGFGDICAAAHRSERSSSGSGSGRPIGYPDAGYGRPPDAWEAPACPDPGFLDVEVAYGAACAVACDGRVLCWGDAPGVTVPECDGDCAAAPQLIALPAGARVLSVALGDRFACVLRADGEASCWGQLGTLDMAEPTPLVKASGVPLYASVLRAGRDHVCVRELGAEHLVWCLGDNAHGQLLDREVAARDRAVLAEVLFARGLFVGGDRTFIDSDHSVVVAAGARLPGLPWPVDLEGPVPGPELHQPLVNLATTLDAACALPESGGVVCWGGAGSLGAMPPPSVPIAGMDADESGASLLLWTHDGDVLAMGRSDVGLFAPSADAIPTPVTALDASVVHEVSVGGDSACAITGQTRAISCWGRNDLGQLGRGDTTLPGERVEDLRAAPPRW